jgi:hypothetical protein
MDLSFSENEMGDSLNTSSPKINEHQIDEIQNGERKEQKKTLKHSNSVLKRESSHRQSILDKIKLFSKILLKNFIIF